MPNDNAGTAETQLSDGTLLRVEVAGRDDALRLARLALDGAAGAIAAHANKRREREKDLSDEAGIVGRSAPMQELFRILDRIRGSNATALILGENGTGKELVARAIHRMSKRADKRFVATNCSAFNDNLLESELFGHKRGSFTGAVGDKPGLFTVADGGTFFLDEVGDMSPALQVKLLRVLQEGVFMPVGATEQKKVDVRIIAATNRDLQTMVREGTFREDLYYRLNVVQIRVPSLRERKDDIPLLGEFFLRRLAERDGRHKTLSRGALDRLLTHHWPGNVRELENEIERLWVLSGDEHLIGEEHLSPTVGRSPAPERRAAEAMTPSAEPMALEPGLSLPDAVETLERRMIAEGLRAAKGNKTRAAETLGISRRNLIRKVQAYGLDEVGK
ncbi:MAG: sigma 54-interacting transcriptional regulator [Myxococcales bacterium]|nr:sigma 54-interacting transcriptional regulator [Myxococcales bacterium]